MGNFLERAADVFGSGGTPTASVPGVDVKVLHAKIGQQAAEIDSLHGALTKEGLLSSS